MNLLKEKVYEGLRSNFFKNILTQLLGTGIAQLIPVLATLVLSKIYSPEDFGLYASFLAYSAVLIVLVGGNYHYAIVLPKKKQDAIDILNISLIITLILSLLIFVVIIIFRNFFEDRLGLQMSIYYLPLYVFFYGLWMSLTNLSIRQLSYKNIAIAKIAQAFIYTFVSVFIGCLFYHETGLIIGKGLGLASGVFFLYLTTDISFKKISLSRLKNNALKYINYPKYGIFPALLNTISLQAMVFALQLFYTEEILGYYGFTLLVLTAPLALIGASYKDVFYQKIVSFINLNQYRKAYRLFLISALSLSFVGILMGTTLFFFGEKLFEIFFGKMWIVSGKFASILAISFAVKLVVSPLSSIFNATNQLKKAAIWQSLYFLSTLTLLTVCAYCFKMEIIKLLTIFMIHEVLLYLIYFFIQHNLIHEMLKKEELS